MYSEIRWEINVVLRLSSFVCDLCLLSNYTIFVTLVRGGKETVHDWKCLLVLLCYSLKYTYKYYICTQKINTHTDIMFNNLLRMIYQKNNNNNLIRMAGTEMLMGLDLEYLHFLQLGL